MTQVRCRACATFYDKKAKACPECETPKVGVNLALVHQAWESNLNSQAAHALKNA